MLDLPIQMAGPTLAVLSVVGLIVAAFLFGSQRQIQRPAAVNRLTQSDAVELVAVLDERIGALEQLLRQAQEQAARLETVVERAATLRAVNRTSPPSEHPTSQLIGQAARLAALRPAEAPAPAAIAARRYDDIYALADAGQKSDEIASRVGSPVGEVELILSLRGRRSA